MQTFTIPALRRAIENRDDQTLTGFYAEDAVLRIIDQENPPSTPHEISGRQAIGAYYADVCGRAMTHRVDTGIIDGERAAFAQTCTYPDGKRVFCAATLDLAGGRIARQTSVQAWDS